MFQPPPSTPASTEDFQRVMREAVKNWHDQMTGKQPDVAELQKRVRLLRRQRNFLVTVLVSIAGTYVKHVLDGQVKKHAGS
jgi:hypothetical protein